MPGQPIRSPELKAIPLLFRETFRTRAETLKNGATLVGTGTTFSGDGVTFNGSGNLSYAVSGAQLFRSTLTIKIEFTLGFAANDGVDHFLCDAQGVNARFYVWKKADNSLLISVAGAVTANVAYATWSAALVVGRNVLIISSTTGVSTTQLNGTVIATSAGIWNMATLSNATVFAVGSAFNNTVRFVGTIHSLEIYGAVSTSLDEPLLRQGNLVEGIDFSQALSVLPLRGYYKRASDNLYVTDVEGKGTVSQALMGSNGITTTEFPSIIRPNGASFDGGDQINLGGSDQYSFTTGLADRPFSIAFIVTVTSTVAALVMCKATNYVTVGEWVIYSTVVGRTYSLAVNLIDNGAYISRYANTRPMVFGVPYVFAFTYSGNGALSGMASYVNGVRHDTTSLVGGVYACMKNTAAPVTIGNPNVGLVGLRGSVILPSIWDKELSPAQVRALSARMLWEAKRS